jgi:hypothetical protein
LEQLPAAARIKHARLADAVTDCRDLARSVSDRMGAREHALGMAKNAAITASHPIDRERAEAEISFLTSELTRLDAERSKIVARGRNCERVLSQVNSWITGHLFYDATILLGPLRDAGAIEVELHPDEDLRAAILRLRSEIGDARREFAYAASAPPTRSEIESAVRKQVQDWAREGRPVVRLLEGGKVQINMPDIALFANPGQALMAPSGALTKMMAARDPESLIAWILSAAGIPTGGISASDRKQRTDAAQAKLLRLERMEESLIEEALRQNLDVGRRYDANPWAVLQLTAERVQEQEVLVAAE